MNKKLGVFCEARGLTVGGNTAYGFIQGYETNVTVNNFDNVSPVKIHISFYSTDEQKRFLESALRNEQIKFLKFQFTPYGIELGLNDMTMGKLVTRLPALLELIYGLIHGNGGVGEGICPVCGNPFREPTKCKVGWYEVTIDAECKKNINAVRSARRYRSLFTFWDTLPR